MNLQLLRWHVYKLHSSIALTYTKKSFNGITMSMKRFFKRLQYAGGTFLRGILVISQIKFAHFNTIAKENIHQPKPHNIRVGYSQEFNITVEEGKCLTSNVGLYSKILSIKQNIDKKLEKEKM